MFNFFGEHEAFISLMAVLSWKRKGVQEHSEEEARHKEKDKRNFYNPRINSELRLMI